MNKCQKCGKRAVVGRQVSHSGVRTRKVFRPNLHKYRGMVFCTKCLRMYKETEVKKIEKVVQTA